MKIRTLPLIMIAAFLLSATSAHAELKRVEMSVFGMD